MIFMGVPFSGVVTSSTMLYMMIIIFKIEHADRRGPGGVSPGRSEMLQRRLAQRVGKPGVVDGARQHQCADHRRDGDEGVLVRAGLPPVGRLAGDEVDHLLDAARGGAPYLGRLARHLRAERGSRAAGLDAFDMRLREIGLHHRLQRLSAAARLAAMRSIIATLSLPARSAASASIASREAKWA